jgi:hypothetical protein
MAEFPEIRSDRMLGRKDVRTHPFPDKAAGKERPPRAGKRGGISVSVMAGQKPKDRLRAR